jgi:hypothetical protein
VSKEKFGEIFMRPEFAFESVAMFDTENAYQPSNGDCCSEGLNGFRPESFDPNLVKSAITMACGI